MKHKVLFAALVSLLSVCAFAQDEVALNNGNVIKGKVLRNDKDSVIVESVDGKIYGYRAIEVREVASGSSLAMPQDPDRKPYVDFSSQHKGWWCAAELNSGAMFLPEVAGMEEVAFVNGYRFSEYIRIGVGVAARLTYVMPSQFENVSVAVPVYFDARGNFISQYSRNYSPYWQVDLGYAFDASNPADAANLSGFFFSPTLGMKIGGWRHNFLVGISYVGQMFNAGGAKLANAVCLRLSYEF